MKTICSKFVSETNFCSIHFSCDFVGVLKYKVSEESSILKNTQEVGGAFKFHFLETAQPPSDPKNQLANGRT